MTTAHRATWKAARGGLQEEGSFRLHVPSGAESAKDAPTERNLKLRVPSETDSREKLRAQLEGSEAPVPKRQRKSRFGPPLIAQPGPSSYPSHTVDSTAQEMRKSNMIHVDQNTGLQSHQDEKNADGLQSPTSDDNASEADDDSEDDEAELLAELENIRREREFARAKKQAEEQEQQERDEISRVAVGNPVFDPLSHMGGEISDTASIATGSIPAFAVRRRWNDDLVFRSRDTSEHNSKQQFINDTIRNDFHRSFMKRHMR